MDAEVCAFLFLLLFRLKIEYEPSVRANLVKTAHIIHLSSFQNTVIPGLRIYDLLSTFMLLLF